MVEGTFPLQRGLDAALGPFPASNEMSSTYENETNFRLQTGAILTSTNNIHDQAKTSSHPAFLLSCWSGVVIAWAQ